MRFGSDYDGTPLLVAGKIRGLRAFSVTHSGTLTGVTYEEPWSPGVNRAHCVYSILHARRDTGVAGLNCSCGYHAFFNGENVFAGHDRVTGIIEAWGTVTAGTRGFRAAEAEIVALVLPSQTRLSWAQMNLRQRLRHRLECYALCGVHYGTRQGKHYPALARTCTLSGSRPAVPVDAVREKYHNVPVFATVKQALKAFPVNSPLTASNVSVTA